MELKRPPLLSKVSNGTFFLRPAAEEEMTPIFLMGQDAWGQHEPTQGYIETCMNSEKYRLGKWSVLTSHDGQLLSSVISYSLSDKPSELCIGIGSLATSQSGRLKGHGLTCLSMLIDAYEKQFQCEIFMLFSDIESGIYEAAGFRSALSLGYVQQANNLMIRSSGSQQIEILNQTLRYF